MSAAADRARLVDDGHAAVRVEPVHGLPQRVERGRQRVTGDETGAQCSHRVCDGRVDGRVLPTRRRGVSPRGAEQREEFAVALGTGDRRRFDLQAVQSYLMGAARDLVDHARVNRRIGDKAARADLRATGLELWLDERDDPTAAPQQRRHDGPQVPERDERDVDCDEVERAGVGGHWSAVEVARVRALDGDHARIGPQLPIELAVADVERDDARGAVASSTSVKPAGRRADVERDRARADRRRRPAGRGRA